MEPTTPSGSPDKSSIANIVIDYLNTYSNHNIEKIISFYTDEIEIYDGAFDSTSKGVGQVKEEVVKVFLDLVPDLKWQHNPDTPITVDGDMVAIEWQLSGTPSSKLESLPEEVKGPFACKGMSRFKIDRSRRLIISHSDYFNPPSFFAYI